MKKLRGILAILLTAALPALYAGTVAADSVSAVQQITVTAKVLAARHIIVDQAGNITEITSNTAEDVTPQVFLGSDLPNNRIQMTASVLAQYKKLIPAGSGKAEILHPKPLTASPVVSLLSIMTPRLR